MSRLPPADGGDPPPGDERSGALAARDEPEEDDASGDAASASDGSPHAGVDDVDAGADDAGTDDDGAEAEGEGGDPGGDPDGLDGRSSPPPRRRRWGRVFAALLGVAALGAAATGGYLWSRHAAKVRLEAELAAACERAEPGACGVLCDRTPPVVSACLRLGE
ncbi:MAG TPA: hypothetical protein PLU22_19805, partial [Polyangiaceae bacterium]|nr:hypothetical protein [Polyangiaceae bacterium]